MCSRIAGPAQAAARPCRRPRQPQPGRRSSCCPRSWAPHHARAGAAPSVPQPTCEPVMLSMPNGWRGRSRTNDRAPDGGRTRPGTAVADPCRRSARPAAPEVPVQARESRHRRTAAGIGVAPCQLCGNLQWRPTGTLLHNVIDLKAGDAILPAPWDGARGGRTHPGPAAQRTVLTGPAPDRAPTPEWRGGRDGFGATGPCPAGVEGTGNRRPEPSGARPGCGRLPAPPCAGRGLSGSRVELLDSGHAH